MAQKGGKFDASGYPITSYRIVTDTDADTGIGSQQDPMRVDPTGTTVQPVSFSGPVTVTGGLTDTQLRASAVPVSVGSIALPTGAATEATLAAAKADLDTLAGTVSAAKVAISAASLPLPTGAALDATLTGGTAKTKIVDTGGTNVASVSAAGAVKVDGSAVTQPVSAASLPLPTGAALDATLTGGTTKVRVTGNAGATIDSTVGAGTAPTNQVVVGTVANSAAPSPTAGQALALQSDLKGNLRVNSGTHTTVRSTSTGAQQTITVPAATKYVLMGGYFELDCSATVATRQLILDVKDASGNIVATIVPSPTFAASAVGAMTFGPGLPAQAAAVLNNFTWPLPQLALGASFTVVTRVQNLQVGDVVILNINVISTPA